MNAALAQTMLDTARAEATRLGLTVCITIVDAAAWPIGFVRMDGTPLGSIDVSRKKARTAVLFQMKSAEFATIAHPDDHAYSLENTNGGLTSFGGGIPLRDTNGTVIGGIGVSGASSEDDVAIARVAAQHLLS